MTQLDRIEGRLQQIDDRTRAIELEIATIKGGWRALVTIRHAVTACIAAVAGAFGGHIPFPWNH